jgi:DNA mismatch repair protein MutL
VTVTSLPPPPHIVPLSPELVERIAAGEVIERPLSAVKELLENAIDAAARDIRVEVQRGGLELIRVSDDGWGILPDETPLAFARHATSKIRAPDDLHAVRTLGFRGEALASIAAVAEVTLLTAADDSGVGIELEAQDGAIIGQRKRARTRGTTVTVRDLFRRVPARLKFARSPRIEARNIAHLVRAYALAYPRIRFTLTFDGQPSVQTSGSGDGETALAEIFDTTATPALHPFGPIEVAGITIRGYMSDRELTQPGRQWLLLFVNGRWVRANALLNALENGYRPLLPKGRHPVALLHLRVPPERLDVNVHPAKTEVLLLDERAIADALEAAVREHLGKRPASPPGAARSVALGRYRQLTLPGSARRRETRLAESSEPYETLEPDTFAPIQELAPVAQVQDRLILAVDGRNGMYLVDQHRAHERALYDELRRRYLAGAALGEGMQFLLEPVVVELAPRQAVLLRGRLPELEALGFACEEFGMRSFLVRALPGGTNLAALSGDIPALLAEATEDTSAWQDHLLIAVACRSAIRRGQALAPDEQRQLLRELAGVATPAVCPHGSVTIVHYSGDWLRKVFGW